MAQDEQVDAALAATAQQRHEDALAGVALARVLRAGIEQQGVMARSHQHRRALADVGGDDVEAPLARQRLGRHEQGERERQRQQPGAPRQRHHDQRGREQTGELRPERRDRDGPDRARPLGEKAQQGDEALHDGRRQRPERRDRDAGQRERRDDQRDERDRDEVGEKADDRDLLEEDQRQRRQAQRRDDLRAQLGADMRLEARRPCAPAARDRARRARARRSRSTTPSASRRP